MALTYSALLDLSGATRVDVVQASDGTLVSTGKISLGGELVDVELVGDAKPTEAYQAWLAAGGKLGDPVSVMRPREATSYALVAILTDDEVAALGKAKAKDQHLFGKRNDAWPEDNPKIKRLTDALGTTPKAWFDRVFAPAS